MAKPIITDRQRKAQEIGLTNALELLKVAIGETRTATPDETSQTIDIVLGIVSGVNDFLKTREG